MMSHNYEDDDDDLYEPSGSTSAGQRANEARAEGEVAMGGVNGGDEEVEEEEEEVEEEEEEDDDVRIRSSNDTPTVLTFP